MDLTEFDIQGHRGCRGILPENSIPAFLHAIELGVTTLEMDAVISKDELVIISHEPFMSAEICNAPYGEEILKDNEALHNLYQLDYNEIKAYDCGTKYHERFPNQESLATYKPSLLELIETINTRLSNEISSTLRYNIEIKRKKKWDNSHHPSYKRFADLVIDQIRAAQILPQSTVQCFDIETLQYLHKQYPEVDLVYLIEDKLDYRQNIEELGFVPQIYSPNYKLVSAELVRYCKTQQMILIPWTVNEMTDMEILINMGVHGIISDYPDRLISVVSRLNTAKN